MQNNNHTENPFETRQKTGPPSEIEDPFSKNKTITSEADMNVNKVSTEEEIKNRKILKITGPKKVEEEESSKRLFVFNNNNKDNKDQTSSSNATAPSLFSNPFNPKAGGIFMSNTPFGAPTATTAKTEETKKTSEAENQPKIFEDKPNNPFMNKAGDSIFKNPFTSNAGPSGGLFGSNTNTTGGSLFGNLNNPKPSGLFANAPSLFPATATNSIFSNPAPTLFGSSNINFNTTAGQKGFESSEEDGSDFEDPEAEVEINPKGEGKKMEAVKIEVNEKMLKIPCSEFFIYDFAQKKYISIGKGDFSIEFAKTDEKKENPLLIFRNSVLKILFQGIFKAGVTKLETVNKNFKTISVIQKALVINEQNKKLEFKSVKIFHVNDSESKTLIESFVRLEKDAQQSNLLKATEQAKVSQKQTEESSKEEIDINQVSKKSQSSAAAPLSQNAKPESISSKKQADDTANKNAETIAKSNVININKVDVTSKPASKQQPETVTTETKTNIFSQYKNQNNLSQKENEAVDDKSKIITATESKSKLVFAESTPGETKIVITESSQNKPNEKNEQITIQVSNNQPTGSKGLIKVASQAEGEKPASKEKVSQSIDAPSSQSNKPISVGKITNINIQLISSNKSQSQD